MKLEAYALSSTAIYSLLKEKKVDFLYHANTIATSITFIQNRALLSRGFVEKNGLAQTSQNSDEKDKKYDVWDDVFLDGADLHTKYSRANKYGPVLFRLNLDLLNSPLIDKVYVTKTNPWYWTETMTLSDKYYTKIEDVKDNYLTGKRVDARIMFTIKKPNNLIKLNKFLHSIGLDKPTILIPLLSGGKKEAGDYAHEALQAALEENGLGHIPILIRHNGKVSSCWCHTDYASLNGKEFHKRFAKNPK